ncbi:MAG: hypothetical protein ABJC39_07865 [Chloroflexota bacterium]
MNSKRAGLLGTIALAIVLAIAWVGCGPWFGASVALRTSVGPGGVANGNGSYTVGCYTSGTQGDLVADPNGVAIVGKSGTRTMVVWPAGFTGRQFGGEIAILDRSGNVVARTGTKVYLEGGYENGGFLTCETGIHPPH